jgi:hypothetical protein
MRRMLGVAAATALPSEIWPFRKIFLPPARKIIVTQLDHSHFILEASNYVHRPFY